MSPDHKLNLLYSEFENVDNANYRMNENKIDMVDKVSTDLRNF